MLNREGNSNKITITHCPYWLWWLLSNNKAEKTNNQNLEINNIKDKHCQRYGEIGDPCSVCGDINDKANDTI